MRATLADASLARYAGRFVWLELNFDNAKNQAFLTHRAVLGTPTFFVINPADEQIAATQIGAMTVRELMQFLDRGAHQVSASYRTPVNAAIARGDQLLARNQPSDAAISYREALRLAPAEGLQRELAVASLVLALQSSSQWQSCAETAAAQAPGMKRDGMFGRTVLAGMWCVNNGEPNHWAETAAGTLEPLAEEAVALPETAVDHRFQLYRTLMYLSLAHDDKAGATLWGDRWLRDIDATEPTSDEERSALDIARVENVDAYGDPSRILSALIASERAMPGNYNASLRLAQMEILAKQYDEAIAACDRGLADHSGPLGRSWLMQTKAEGLMHKGQPTEAHQVLEEALRIAQAIPVKRLRENNIAKISNAIKQAEEAEKGRN